MYQYQDALKDKELVSRLDLMLTQWRLMGYSMPIELMTTLKELSIRVNDRLTQLEMEESNRIVDMID